MRDFKGMKRQRGRNRTGGGAPSNSGGGGKPQQNVNRAFDSNGPDNVKIRGHAQHVFEKYQQLARDAFSSGDRVLAENYLQHADHYFRVLRTIQPNRAPAEILGRDVFASGLDIDFEDESENGAFEEGPIETPAGETAENSGDQQQQRFDNGRSEQRYDRDNNRYESRSDNNRQDYRQDSGRQDGGRQDGGQDNGRTDNSRQDNQRQDGSRQNNNRNDRYERQGQGSGQGQSSAQNGQGSGQETRRDYQDGGRYEPRRDGQDNRSNGRYADNRDRDRDNRSDASRNDRDDQSRETQNRDAQPRDTRSDTRRDYQEPRAQETRNDTRRDYQESRQDGRQETSANAPREETRDAPIEGRTRRQRAPREGRYGARTDEGQGADVQTTDTPAADVQTSEPTTPQRAEPQGLESMAVIEPQSAPLTPVATVSKSAAKAEMEPSPVLRSQDGGFSEAPAFLQAPVVSEDGEVRKPRVRRRRPKALEGAEDGGEATNVSEDA